MQRCLPFLLALLCGCQNLPSLSLKAPELSPPRVEFSNLTGPAVTAPSTPPPADLTKAEDAKVNLQMAREFEKHGHDREAIQYYEKVRTLDAKTPGIAWKLGVLHTHLEEFDAAMEEFKKAYEAEPKNSDLLNDIGYGCYQGGRWEEAELWFRRALEMNPKNTRAQGNLGLALGQQGKFQAAFDAFRPVTGEAGAYHNLGMLHLAQKRTEDAKAAFRQALSIDANLNVTKGVLEKLDNPAASRSSTIAAKSPAPGKNLSHNMTPPQQPEVPATPLLVQADAPAVPVQGGVESVSLFNPPSPPTPAVVMETRTEQAAPQWQPVAEEMPKNFTPRKPRTLRLSAPIPVAPAGATEVSSVSKAKLTLGAPVATAQ